MSFYFGPQAITNGLVLYYDANKSNSYPGTGTLWKDLSRNPIMTDTNGVPYTTNQINSFTFNGSSNYITGSDPTTKLNVGANGVVTIEALINVAALASGQFSEIFLYGSDSTGFGINYGLYLYNAPSTGITLGFISNTTGQSSGGSLSSDPLSLDTWYHVVLAVTPTMSTPAMKANRYINGQELAQSINFNTLYPPHTSNFIIGAAPTSPFYGPASCFNGQLALLKVYNRTLSANEVASNYRILKQKYPILS